MKKESGVKIITVILLIALITIISIFGIYVKDEYRMKNLLPKYKLGMEFNKTLLLEYKVDDSIETEKYDQEGNLVTEEKETEEIELEMIETEEKTEEEYNIVEIPANSPEVLTRENYLKTKKILENRLSTLGINQYNIRLNEKTGKLSLEIESTLENEKNMQYIIQKGGFTIVDAETEEVLIANEMVQDTSVVYGSELTETIVYVKVDLDENGKNKLKEISQKYTPGKTLEDGTTTEDKKVNIMVADTNYFGEGIDFEEVMETGTIYLPVGVSSNQEEVKEYSKAAQGLKIILGNDTLPIKYNVSAEIVEPNINNKMMTAFLYVALTIITILIAIFIIKFKTMGLLGILLETGYVSILLLLVRYTNVVLTVEGIAGIVLISVINFVVTFKLLRAYNQKLDINKEFKKFIFTLVPILIVSVVFVFINMANIASFGTTLLWGTLLIGIYNILITNTIFKLI